MYKTHLFKLFSILAILAFVFSNVQPSLVEARSGDGLKREHNTANGRVSFIGPDNGRALPAARALGQSILPQDPAMALARRYGPEFGIKDAGRELIQKEKHQKENGQLTVKYQQQHENVPVMGGELIVNTDGDGNLYSINGEVSPGLSLSMQPGIDAESARESALQSMAKWYQKSPEDFNASEPELWIYDESLLQPSTRPAELVWRMEVTAKDNSLPVRELVLVNAQRGSVSLHFNQVDTAGGMSTQPDASPTPQPLETQPPVETPEPVVTPAPVNEETPSDVQTAAPGNHQSMEVTSSGVTWYVATTGSDSNTCSAIATPCKTIQAALDKASAGDTVKLAANTFVGNASPFVFINKTITLSGGWNPSFTIQNGISTLDGQNTYSIVQTGYSTTANLDHLLMINSSFNGLYVAQGATVTANNVAVAGSAQAGIAVYGTLDLNNSTVGKNMNGGINVSYNSHANINNSTIAGNSAIGNGGGIWGWGSGSVHLKNTIVARNTAQASAPDCYGAEAGVFVSEGNNILQNLNGCNLSPAISDKTNIDPELTEWLAAGYFALLANSPAMNAGNPASCLVADQRGVARDSACDIGAYEYTPTGPAASFILQSGGGQRATVNQALSAPLQALALDSVGSPVSNVNVTFTAPSSGPSGTFTGGSNTVSVQTNQSGIATSPAFTVNNLTGTYNVDAAAAGIQQPVHFSVTNAGWYLAPTGSDTNSCFSPNAPCATFAGVINKALSGDTIFVAEGTYYGYGGDLVYFSNDQYLDFIGGWNAGFTARTGRSTIDGQGMSRGINNFRGYVTFEHFIIQNCSDGAINSGAGSFKLVDSIVRNNVAANYAVAGISAGGTLTIIDSLITGNTSNVNTLNAPAGMSSRGVTTLTNTTVSNNKSTYGSGAGIVLTQSASLLLNNSTISGNSAALDGGGILADYGTTLNMNNSTIANNTAKNGGGVFIRGDTGVFNIQNSIIANNTAGENGPDCYNVGNPFDTLNYSLLGNTSSCAAVSEAGGLKNVTPKIAPLAVGWPGFHPLAADSPAINAGNSSTCLATDQRGTSRGSSCDMGAVEYVAAGSPSSMQVVSGSPQRTMSGGPYPAPFKVMVTDAGQNLVSGVSVTFTAPASGPSGTFSTTHTNLATVLTQSDGVATAPLFTANTQAGGYFVSAAGAGIAVPSQFQVTNYDNWFVATTGNDANDCMAVSTPCASINGVFAKSLFLPGDTIKVAGGTYQSGPVATEVVTISKSANISGGWDSTFTAQNQTSVIDGQNARRGVSVSANATVVLDHLTIKNGQVYDAGAGISNAGTLSISNCMIEKNQAGYGPHGQSAAPAPGGGIYSTGALTITNSSIQGNTADGGGGIYSNTKDSLTIIQSKIIGNVANGSSGGGISYHYAGGYLYDDKSSITSSTISGNSAWNGGGIAMDWGLLIFNNSAIIHNVATSGGGPYASGGGISTDMGEVHLNNSTVSSNFANGDGGGLYNSSGKIYLNNATISFNTTPPDRYGAGIYNRADYAYYSTIAQNSLIALNSDGRDCYGYVTSNGYNLVGSIGDKCYYASAAGDLLGTPANPIDPLLSMPRDNGGGTYTAGLFANSPALDAGNPATPGSNPGSCLPTDQRGIARPVGTGCDIGAFEGSIPPAVDTDILVFTNDNWFNLEKLISFVCDSSQVLCTNGANPDADKALAYALGTHDLYRSQYQRNSITGSGLPVFITVDYAFGDCPNAFWDGILLTFCSGMVADDVAAHELTHGVTQYESNLFYYYQSGAINESFSDLWGEYYDQTNGLGNDSASVRWIIGEDTSSYPIPVGFSVPAIRSMSNPPALGDPDRMSSTNYYKGAADNGGVHWNSGVNNKAVYLMVDGGTFNGKTVTALGWDKVGAIYYEANTNLLTSGADYSDLYYAVRQACTNLVGQKDITAEDCMEVKDALDAVEMNSQPAAGYNPDAPLCATAGAIPNMIFADDLESGTGYWSFTNGAYNRWQYDSPYGQYAQSGSHFLFADDDPDVVTDAQAQLTAMTIPSSAYLWFAQAYDFEYDSQGNYDGGVLEYSTNNGSTWTDAGSLIEANGYKGTISTGYSNPLGGRKAFVGSSHGYISTRLNLKSLAGKTVNFRWRMGLDQYGAAWGWWVDDIKLYQCSAPVKVSIGGSMMGSYDLLPDNVVVQSYPATQNGPVKVTASAGTTVFSSERVVSGSSFNEVMGFPTNQLTTEYWFPWYENKSMATWILVGNPSATAAKVDIYVAGVKRTSAATIPAGGRITPRYAGVQGGPVRVVSTNGVKIFASERATYGPDNAFNEMMGYPASQFTKEYWFPWYDNKSMATWLLVGNPSTTSAANVDIYIGGVKKGSYIIAKGRNITQRFTGIQAGPVRVVSTNNVPVITSERTIAGNSFNEIMGSPASQFTTEYFYPWYDNVTMATWVLVGNPTGSTAKVDIYMGAVKQGSYTIGAGKEVNYRFGLNTGPVRVVSSNGVKIFSSERVLYGTSFNEVMGYPGNQLTTEYWFPWYDSTSMSTDILVGRP